MLFGNLRRILTMTVMMIPILAGPFEANAEESVRKKGQRAASRAVETAKKEATSYPDKAVTPAAPVLVPIPYPIISKSDRKKAEEGGASAQNAADQAARDAQNAADQAAAAAAALEEARQKAAMEAQEAAKKAQEATNAAAAANKKASDTASSLIGL